jgi:hypothetical protein
MQKRKCRGLNEVDVLIMHKHRRNTICLAGNIGKKMCTYKISEFNELQRRVTVCQEIPHCACVHAFACMFPATYVGLRGRTRLSIFG